MDLDPYGRPPSRTSGEAAFMRDVAQARSGNVLSYGGRRFVGEVRRGGLLGSPAVLYGFPVRSTPLARRASTAHQPSRPARRARLCASASRAPCRLCLLQQG
jgi:hypothetical protein